MKKLAKISFLLFVALFSCTIRDGEIIDLINSVKKQNDDLKAQIYALKKTTDSALVAALKINTLQISTVKKIDQIQADLKVLLSQIVSLNTQMSALNAEIGPLKAKIDVLQSKCAELLAQIATLNYNLNSKGFTKIDNLTWTQVISGNSWRLLANLDSSVLYLSRPTDVLKSTNFGLSFSATGATFQIGRENGQSNGAAYSNFNGGQLVIAGLDKGFYMSNDNGVSFSLNGPMCYGCTGGSILALKDGRFIASMGGLLNGIYKSTGPDNQSWINKWAGIELITLDFSQNNNNVIYAASNAGILKSINQGEAWSMELASTNTFDYFLDVECVNDSLYFLGGENNFYVSNTSSLNKKNIRYKFPSNIVGPHIIYSNVYNIFVGVSWNSGIYISNNRGITWKLYALPGVANYYNNVTIIKNKIFITTNSGLYVMTL